MFTQAQVTTPHKTNKRDMAATPAHLALVPQHPTPGAPLVRRVGFTVHPLASDAQADLMSAFNQVATPETPGHQPRVAPPADQLLLAPKKAESEDKPAACRKLSFA